MTMKNLDHLLETFNNLNDRLKMSAMLMSVDRSDAALTILCECIDNIEEAKDIISLELHKQSKTIN
jgi:hypothetical protein